MQQSQIIHANSQVIQASKGQMSIQTQNGQNPQVIAQQYGNQPLNQQGYSQQPTVNTVSHGYRQPVTTHAVVQQPTVVIRDTSNYVRNKYAYRVGIGLGITRIVIGILCIIMHGVAIAGEAIFMVVGHGIWCGAFFIVTGSFGVSAGRSRKKCLIVTHMVLSIVSASAFVPSLISTSARDIAAMNPTGCVSEYCTRVYYMPLGTAAESVLLCLAVIEFIIDIIAAAFCCKAVCCCEQPWVTLNGEFPNMQQPQVIVMQNPTMTGGQSGTMYMQPGVGQPMMNQPPAYKQQGETAYDNQGYNNTAAYKQSDTTKLIQSY